MKRFAVLAIPVLLGLFVFSGCRNAVYFYQTDKISFTAEARPDGTSPLSATLGIKQKVALIVPSKEGKIKKDARNTNESEGDRSNPYAAALFDAGYREPEDQDSQRRTLAKAHDPQKDAMSVISYFNFNKYKADKGDRFVIETAFITGTAASSLKKGQAAEAARAISQSGTPANRLVLVSVFRLLKEQDRQDRLAGNDNEPAGRILERLNRHAQIVPDTFDFAVYTMLPAIDPGSQERVDTINVWLPAGDEHGKKDSFAEALSLIDDLEKSAQTIEAELSHRPVRGADNKWYAEQLSPDEVREITAALAPTELMIERLQTDLLSSPALDEALRYYLSGVEL